MEAGGGYVGLNKGRAVYFARLIVSVLAIAVLLWLVDLRNLPKKEDLRFSYIIYAALVVFADRMFNAFRWSVLVRAGGMHIGFKEVLKIYFSTSFIGLVLPSSIGGEVLKGYGLAKATSKTIDSASSVIIDRITGLVALSAFCVAGYYLASPSLQQVPVVSGIKGIALLILIGSVAVVCVGLWIPVPRWETQGEERKPIRIVKRVWSSFRQYRDAMGAVAISFVVACVVRALRIALVWLAGLGVGLSLEPTYYVLFVPFIQLGGMIPVSLAGVGVEEGAAVYLFSLVGAGSAGVLAMFIVVRVLVILSVCPGGWIYFREGLGAKRSGGAAQQPSERSVRGAWSQKK